MSAPDRDHGLADRIAAALRQERQRELEAAVNPPPRPVAPVPDWLFGPKHREMESRRFQECEARRAAEEDSLPEVLAPLADPSGPPAAVERCPWCNAAKVVEP